MSHRHLVLAYCVTWIIQLSYAGLLGAKWVSVKKAEREFPTYEDVGE